MDEKQIIITIEYISSKGVCHGKVVDMYDNFYKVKGNDDGIVIEIDRKFTHIINMEIQDTKVELNYNGITW